MTTKYDNSGTMFVNDRKEKDAHPDRTGSATIDGKEFWVSGWIKQPDKSKPPFLSLAFKPKEAKAESTRQPMKADREMGDDIPW